MLEGLSQEVRFTEPGSEREKIWDLQSYLPVLEEPFVKEGWCYFQKGETGRLGGIYGETGVDSLRERTKEALESEANGKGLQQEVFRNCQYQVKPQRWESLYGKFCCVCSE